MEILMKLKCSPTPTRSSKHSLKNIERIQQHQKQQQLQLQQQQQQHIPCLDYGNSTRATPNIDCCNPHGNYMNVQARCCGNSGYCSTPLPPCCGVGRSGGNGGPAMTGIAPPAYTSSPNTYLPQNPQNYNMVEDELAAEDCNASYEYQEPEENFVSIDDAKIKGFLMKIGQEQRVRREEEEQLRQQQQQQQEIAEERNRRRMRRTSPKVVYEIIDLDDEEEREKLKRIKNQAEFDCNMKLLQQQHQKHESEQSEKLLVQQPQQLNWEQKETSIELQRLKTQTPTRQSPDISLVPAAASKNKICPVSEQKKQIKYARTENHQQQHRQHGRSSSDGPLRIIAQIELLDSSDEETEARDGGRGGGEEAEYDDDDDDEDDDEPVEREEKNNIVLQVMSDDEGNDALVPAQSDNQLHHQQQQQKQQQTQEEYITNDSLSFADGTVAEEREGEGDNDDNEVDAGDDEDYEDLPLAASSVSCELECDDDDINNINNNLDVVQKLLKNNKNLKITKTSSIKHQNLNENNKDIVRILASDEENEEFIDEHEEGLELRWDELELGTRGTRNNFECFVCGKKVQSNYNLRRHMMIHTGERPFGCDLCDRRFREFSDLKKHRRRHANEPSFVCMVCRINPPTDCDPTRCNNCDSKMGAMIAMRSKTATEPNGSEDVRIRNVAPIAKVLTSSQLLSQKKTQPLQPLPPLPPLTKATVTTEAAATLKGVPAQLTLKPSKNTNTNTNNTTIIENAVQQLPPLTPIGLTAEDQLVLLDHIPPVYRSSYNKGVGMVTRKEFPCPLCQRPFGTRHNLKRHFMIHTGEKPFSCGRCRKPFREYSTLKKHMITHARDRWYKCLRCPQKYLDYLEYMSHKVTHTEDNMGSGAEDASGSSSNSAQSSPNKRSRLMLKEESLEGSQDDDDDDDNDSSVADDWLECCECGQRFTEFDVYTEHLKSHDTHALIYECYVCKQTLENMKAFEQHMRQEHGTFIDSDDDDDDDDNDNNNNTNDMNYDHVKEN